MLNTFSEYPQYIFSILYAILFSYTVVKILLNTHSSAKTLAYILLIIIVPFFGIVFYFAFGSNYRHRKITRERTKYDHELIKDIQNNIPDYTSNLLASHQKVDQKHHSIVEFLINLCTENLSSNRYELLVNGEEKFPEVLKSLELAENFIHMEYYDWENDTRGNQITDLLLKKVEEGLKVRVMYDAYASRKIRHNLVRKMRKGGIDIYPVIDIKMVRFANRMNHRDHRKIIIIDGQVGFVGGINISDRYDNSIDTGLFWRDTHVKITGNSVLSLQRHFIINWNSCQPNKLKFSKELFPFNVVSTEDDKLELAQIVPGGPLYPASNIMLTYFKIFTLAKEKLYITNPYFIPNESILDALKQSAYSGVDVRIMMPYKSDSVLVGAAVKFYYKELLEAGVKIFLYKKGFVHAKTVVADTSLSIVGTANMDMRSFDLNFEMMAVIYGDVFAKQLEKVYEDDLKECVEITSESWSKIGLVQRLFHSIARLISSFL